MAHARQSMTMNENNKNRFPYVYLVSTAYAGSTLLSMLVDSHPEVACIGELANSVSNIIKNGSVNKYYCSCGEEIASCHFWIKVKKRNLQNGIEIDLHDFDIELDLGLGMNLNRIIFGVPGKNTSVWKFRDALISHIPVYKNTVNQLIHRNIAIAKSILDVLGKTTFFDASKDVRRVTHLAKNKKIELKLIHLVRDSKGVLSSYLKHQGNTKVSKVLRNWKRTNEAAINLKSLLPKSSYMLVRYESLCREPEEIIFKICQFLDIEEFDCIRNVNQQKHHIIGNNMRCKPFQGIRLDHSWEMNLSPIQITECDRISSDVYSKFDHVAN